MSTVRNLIHLFEQLDPTMEPKKVKLKRSSKSLHEKNPSVVKRLVNDFTELKRPAGKRRNLYEANTSQSQTLPRNFKNPKNSTVVKEEAPITKTSFYRNSAKKIESLVTKQPSFKSFCQNDVENQQEMQDEAESIEKKVEDFGDKLRRMRIRSDEKDTNPTVENLEDSSEDESYGNDSDDMFGSNTFENDSDNYIVETYNVVGQELVITTLEISHHYINKNEATENIQEVINSSDYVFHDDKCVRSNSDSESEMWKDCNETVNLSLEHEPVTYNRFISQGSVTESYTNNVIFYQEESTTGRHSIKTQKSTEEDVDVHYENISNNFSTLDNVISVQGEETLAKKRSDFKKKEKLHFMIEELKKTEEFYIDGLKKVVTKYIPYVFTQTPQDLIGRTAYLFGNIEEIYVNAQIFLKELKEAGESPENIGQVFINRASEFELYPLYSKNKPTADLYQKQFDSVIRDRQKQLHDKLGLASYLLTPIQRLGKYVLLLEGILKELNKANKEDLEENAIEKITDAIKVVRDVMRKGNDYIAIDSIKNSDIDLTDKGSFIMRCLFTMLKPRKFESMVFLFENIIVFTEKMGKNLEHFKFLDSIAMSDLSLGKLEDKPNVFQLSSFSKVKKNVADAVYVLEAELAKTKDEWTEMIEKILWTQLKKVKEQQKKLSFRGNKHGAKVVSDNPNQASSSNGGKNKTYRIKKTKSKFYDHCDS